MDRRTVQRYMKQGLLRWHGKQRAGPTAKGIKLLELLKLTSGAGRDGKPRGRRQPVWTRWVAFLKEAGLNSAQVMTAYIHAFAGGMDMDFGAYCIERLDNGDDLFLHLLLEPDNKRLRQQAEPLTVFAADRMRNLAEVGSDGISAAMKRQLAGTGDTASFKKQIVTLFALWVKAAPDIIPSIVVDTASGVADIGLVPAWTREAPRGLLPIVGGKWSMCGVRKGGYYAEVKPVIQAIADAVLKSHAGDNTTGKLQAFLPVLFTLDSEPQWHEFEPGVERGPEKTLPEFLAEKLGVQPKALRRLMRYFRVLKGDALSPDRLLDESLMGHEGGSGQEDPDYDADDDKAGGELTTGPMARVNLDDMAPVRPALARLCRVLGISRNTARRWVQAVPRR